jgi:hypothetical protein
MVAGPAVSLRTISPVANLRFHSGWSASLLSSREYVEPADHSVEDVPCLLASCALVVGAGPAEVGVDLVDYRVCVVPTVGVAHQTDQARLLCDRATVLADVHEGPDGVGEVEQARAWCGVVPVDEGDGLIANEDRVVGTELVVGDDLRVAGEVGASRDVV